MTQALGVAARDFVSSVTLYFSASRVLVPAMERGAARRLISVAGFGAGDGRNAINCARCVPFRLFRGRRPAATRFWLSPRNGLTDSSRAEVADVLVKVIAGADRHALLKS